LEQAGGVDNLRKQADMTNARPHRIVGDNLARFDSKIDRNGPVSAFAPTPCWLWLAGITKDGYGLFTITVAPNQYRRLYAHRFAYEQACGPIPDASDIDHLCRVRHCVNPAHMEPVTRRENTLRGLRGPRSHCVHGHELIGDNVITRKNGRHQCRTCENAQQRARRKRRQSI
jgi:hypothetical protein